VTTARSGFAVRGVIEGFYGNPWTRQQRLELVEFIAARGMNTFVYGPKDDPLVRRAWRDPYRGDDLDRLAELVERCRRNDVEMVYCARRPGQDVPRASSLRRRHKDRGDPGPPSPDQRRGHSPDAHDEAARAASPSGLAAAA
jgi:hypothetical protein